MTTLDIHTVVLAMPHRGPENPLPPLRLLGDLHGDVDGTGLDEEMARNIGYGHVSSVLPYLLQDDYSRELAPCETTVAILENSYLRAMVLSTLVAGSGRCGTRSPVESCSTTTTGYSSAISGCEMPGSRAASSGTWEPQGIRR
jgi:hypothetical protein